MTAPWTSSDSTAAIIPAFVTALQTLPHRVAAKISIDADGCWRWLGCTSPAGYGLVRIGSLRDDTRRMQHTHRFVYEFIIGTIPDGLDLDHLCRVRHCVNPWHVEPVTRRVNVLRGVGLTARNAEAAHCVRGHPFNDENTRVRPNGWRECRTCNRERQRRLRPLP